MLTLMCLFLPQSAPLLFTTTTSNPLPAFKIRLRDFYSRSAWFPLLVSLRDQTPPRCRRSRQPDNYYRQWHCGEPCCLVCTFRWGKCSLDGSRGRHRLSSQRIPGRDPALETAYSDPTLTFGVWHGWRRWQGYLGRPLRTLRPPWSADPALFDGRGFQ